MNNSSYYESLHCLLTGLAFLSVSFAASTFAQENVATTNLGADSAAITGNWLAYSVWESFSGEDLNGDGDLSDNSVHVRDLSTGETTNLRLEGRVLLISGNWLVFADGRDVVHVHDLSTGETRNLGLPTWRDIYVTDDWLVIPVTEGAQETDLNGDGDTNDYAVVHTHNLVRNETTNLMLEAAGSSIHPWNVSGDWLVLSVSESGQAQDLNGDGDTRDAVFHVHNLLAGETTNLGLEARRRYYGAIIGDHVLLGIAEHGADLNNDGDRFDVVAHVHDMSTGQTTNLELALACERYCVSISDGAFVFGVSEEGQGMDLNGDGDLVDLIVYVRDPTTAAIRNLGIAIRYWWGPPWISSEQWLVYVACEEANGEDLNGDGDTKDFVAQVHDLSNGRIRNTRLALAGNSEDPEYPDAQLMSGGWLVLTVGEREHGSDLNGDGDSRDEIQHVYNLSTGEVTNLGLQADQAPGGGDGFPPDRRAEGEWLSAGGREWHSGDFNGDGDTEDRLFHVARLATGETRTFALAASAGRSRISRFWLLTTIEESYQHEDLNGDGDEDDDVYFLVDLARLFRAPVFLRGDCNEDRAVDISDAISTLGVLFLGDGEITCQDACDSNDDSAVDISDAITTLGVLFLGNGIIPLPGMSECGVDPTDDELTCETFERCP